MNCPCDQSPQDCEGDHDKHNLQLLKKPLWWLSWSQRSQLWPNWLCLQGPNLLYQTLLLLKSSLSLLAKLKQWPLPIYSWWWYLGMETRTWDHCSPLPNQVNFGSCAWCPCWIKDDHNYRKPECFTLHWECQPQENTKVPFATYPSISPFAPR